MPQLSTSYALVERMNTRSKDNKNLAKGHDIVIGDRVKIKYPGNDQVIKGEAFGKTKDTLIKIRGVIPNTNIENMI